MCIQVCLHKERECCVRVLGNQLRVDNRDCERMRVQTVHTRVALNKSNAVFHTQRTVARNAAKTKRNELWMRCENQVMESKKESAGVRVGAKRECLSKWAVRVKLHRIDDDAEDERDKEVMCAFHSAMQALDHLRGGDGQSVKCDETVLTKNTVVAESDAIHMLCSVVSFKTAGANQFANRA